MEATFRLNEEFVYAHNIVVMCTGNHITKMSSVEEISCVSLDNWIKIFPQIVL